MRASAVFCSMHARRNIPRYYEREDRYVAEQGRRSATRIVGSYRTERTIKIIPIYCDIFTPRTRWQEHVVDLLANTKSSVDTNSHCFRIRSPYN